MKPPLPNSYWVVPGRLLAGEHPDGGSDAGTRARLETLLAAGVRSFLDLTGADELEPYRGLLPDGIRYQNFSMPDHSLPRSTQQMRDIQQALLLGMRDGAVYVHCRAGIGRTGMTVGCYLRDQGHSADEALTELNSLWQQNARAARWPAIPETEEQEEYIRAWQPGPVAVHPAQRYRGCLVALALGDAMAAAAGAGPLAWTDDTGMTLCVAESLLLRNGFDGRDQLDRYRAWALDPAAAGAAAQAQLRPVVQAVLTRAIWNHAALLGSHDPAQLDASPLARSAAAALFAGERLDLACDLAADIARVTQQAPVLVDACRLLAAMIVLALQGRTRAVVLAAAEHFQMPLRDEVQQLATEWHTPPLGRRKPHRAVLGALDRAVRCFARSRSFDEGMQSALASRSDDRDAICAVYGALAGAYYGYEAAEPELRSRLAGLARIERLADQLHAHGRVAHGVA